MSEQRVIEASGPDIETAITNGITELGVSRGDVIVEILEEPSRGLLGLGSRSARVRLTVIRAPRSAAPAEPTSMTLPEPEPIIFPERVERPRQQPKPAPQSNQDRGQDRNQDRDQQRHQPRDKSRDHHDQQRNQPRRPEREPVREVEYDEDWSSESITPDELAEDAKIGSEILKKLLTHLQVDAQVHTRTVKSEDGEPQHWSLEIQGQELGSLIGRRGETLASLQYITRLIASRDLERRVNILIDVEGYKSRRESILRRLAKRMADQAVQRGRTVTLEPMPPHERRIIHLTLRDNPSVTTESVGEGDRRKVTIIPRRNKNS
jgi:spoIIIJ-associated protein